MSFLLLSITLLLYIIFKAKIVKYRELIVNIYINN